MNLINLPGWQVNAVKDKGDRYEVEAGYGTGDGPAACPQCGPALFPKFHRHGTMSQRVWDTPAHGKQVRITLHRTRWRCQNCGATTLMPLPDVDDQVSMTRRLVAYIERLGIRRTFTSIAAEVGVHEKTVRNVFARHVKRMDAEVVFETPERMGIDEVHLLRRPRGIITNLSARTVVALLEDRNKPTVSRYLRELPDKDRVQVVAMDMWRPYRDAVRSYLPKAVVVVDKWHVLRMADDAVDRVRKAIRAGQSDSQNRRMMRSRYLLRKRPAKLNEDEQAVLDAWLERSPRLAAVYRAKEAFYAVYALEHREQAAAAIAAWRDGMTTQTQTEFRPLLTAIHNWMPEVLAYWDTRETNALTEALNGLAKGIQRQGRGYSYEALRAKLLYDPRAHSRGKPARGGRAKMTDYDSHYRDLLGIPLLGPLLEKLFHEVTPDEPNPTLNEGLGPDEDDWNPTADSE